MWSFLEQMNNLSLEREEEMPAWTCLHLLQKAIHGKVSRTERPGHAQRYATYTNKISENTEAQSYGPMSDSHSISKN